MWEKESTHIFIGLMVQPINNAQINVMSILSNFVAELSIRTKWPVTWHLHVISARCFARDLHTIAPGPLERTCWKQFTVLWGDCRKSWLAPLNAIIIIIIIITIIIILIIILLEGEQNCFLDSTQHASRYQT